MAGRRAPERDRRRVAIPALALALLAALLLGAPTARAGVPAETVEAREHFFGAENVGADGSLPRGRVVLSWFSVGSFAAAIDGRVVLLDSYIHKGEDVPNYVPTTTEELIALDPAAVFTGHGHYDHAKNAGVIAARTGAVVVGAPEHCDQARADAADTPMGPAAVRCVEAAGRGAQPGAEIRSVDALGPAVDIDVVKHVHSAAEPPDGEDHESALDSPPPVDAGSILLHPPGPSVVGGLNPAGEEGGTLLYRFAIGDFSLVWHDSSGPLRERAPHVFDVLRRLPPTDVEVGAVLGFNEPTNGVRDPVDYIATLRPKLFVPNHHDFVSEYGSGRSFEGAVRRELAKRGPVVTDFRWIDDPQDYLRPELLTFDVSASRWAAPRSERKPRLRLTRRCIGAGRLRLRIVGDVGVVRRVSFRFGRRQVARDAAAPFERVIGRRRVERTRARRLRAVVRTRSGPRSRVRLARSLPRCGT